MRFIRPLIQKSIFISMAVLAIFLQGCDPTIYKKPLTDFRLANNEMKEIYFLQLQVEKSAEIEKYSVDRKVKMWKKIKSQNGQDIPGGIRTDQAREIAKLISDKKSEPILKEEELQLRMQAFKVLDTYSGVLISLASNDSTEEIASELNGVVSGVTNVLDKAKRLQKLNGVVEKIEPWLGPLSNAITVLSEIGRIVSNVVRDKAIRETIISADDSIKELIELLRQEAGIAQEGAKSSYQRTEDRLQKVLDHPLADDAAKREITDYLAKAITAKKKLNEVGDMKEVFKLALDAQTSLLKKAASPSYEDWTAHIEAFKSGVFSTKLALQELQNAL